ncbi:MAG TPA: hypothetical protein VM681_00555 [Candidatus Thermoplasmatota archaeon]|nr:hypothetical protein [Candidatus Thermoplasmatota archaeon]
MVRALVLACVLAASALGGCLGSIEEPLAPSHDAPVAAPPARTHVLEGAVEPAEFLAPTFRLLGSVARGGAVLALGEPSVWAHLDGTLYVTFPGCEDPLWAARFFAGCEHGPVYRSDDGGERFVRLNSAPGGRLTADSPAANGDADVAVDAAGTVYASNLGARGIQVFRSDDRGQTWSYLGNATPARHWADRQWMAAGAPGHLIVAWMGGAQSSHRAVAVNTTFDGGESWTGTTYLGDRIGWLGSVQFDPSGTKAFVPFTEGLDADLTRLAGQRDMSLRVARTLDGGRSWDVVDTGVVVRTTATGLHWSGVHMAPSLDVTGDGTIVLAWSQDEPDPTGATSVGAKVRYVTSRDDGVNWSPPAVASDRASAIMPWVTGGAGDRFAIVYYVTDSPLDTDYGGTVWDVVATYVDGASMHHAIVEAAVHVGGICSRGGLCLLTASDRSLLDFFEADLLPDGRLFVTYAKDTQKLIEIRVAVQDGGTGLLARP